MKNFHNQMLNEWIVYEDSSIIVLHKPAGIAVQSAAVGQPDVESTLLTYLSQENGGKEIPYLGIVHRLDQPVEGLLVFAKTPQAAGKLGKQIRDGRLQKKYLALTKKSPALSMGTLENFLVKDARKHIARIADKNTKGAKKAVLHYRVRKTEDRGTLLDIEIETGRFHQIRVQLAAAGMPLVGDQKYNSEAQRERLGLWANKLSFIHPDTGQRMCFKLEDEKLDL